MTFVPAKTGILSSPFAQVNTRPEAVFCEDFADKSRVLRHGTGGRTEYCAGSRAALDTERYLDLNRRTWFVETSWKNCRTLQGGEE